MIAKYLNFEEFIEKTVIYSNNIANNLEESISYSNHIANNLQLGISSTSGIPGKSGLSGSSGMPGKSGFSFYNNNINLIPTFTDFLKSKNITL